MTYAEFKALKEGTMLYTIWPSGHRQYIDIENLKDEIYRLLTGDAEIILNISKVDLTKGIVKNYHVAEEDN